MARKNHDTLPFDTMRLEGALFVPDLLDKIARGEHLRQQAADYQVPKGIKLHDEYGRAFQIALAQWKTFAPTLSRQDVDAATATLNFMRELLRDALGYGDLHDIGKIAIAGRLYPLSLMACGRVPVVIVPHNIALDDPDPRFAVEGTGSRKKSGFQLAQEFLIASQECVWAVVSNGRQLRILRDAATLTRPSYLEFDLETILNDARYPDFAALWRLLHQSRAGRAGSPGTECPWEEWREEGKIKGTRVREGLRHGVTQALLTLGQGFLNHPANDHLRVALHEGSLTSDALFQELLRLVYRFLFLFTLEERDLLHPSDDTPQVQAARAVYAEGYSLRRLTHRALYRPDSERHDDLWLGQRIVLRALQTGEPRLALPALGGLFAPGQCPTLDDCSLTNRAFLTALRHLRWAQVDGALAMVDYGNMGQEELGSVYESLLELTPSVDLAARAFGFVGLTEEGSTSGHARKTTGSYYTPDSLVQELIKSALDPVIEARLTAQPDNPTEALLAISVIDPACGSGHFLFAAARRLAERLAQLRAVDGAARPEDYRHALREVIAHSIYGVDKNPMALELARTALWLEGYEPGRPLSFLDHHLLCGDALLGLTDLSQMEKGIPDAAFKPLSGDDKAICKVLGQANRAGSKLLVKKQAGVLDLWAIWDDDNILARLRAMEAMPDTTPDEVLAKEGAYAFLLREEKENRLTHAADLFTGAFLIPKDPGAGVPTTAELTTVLFGGAGASNHADTLAASGIACAAARVLHWPLAFPQVFAKGGFDCVLANPPWERIKLQEEEFFATRHPEVALARNKAERGQRIIWLAQGMLAKNLHPELLHDDRDCEAEQRLYEEFISARRTAEAASIFAHVKGEDGGRYPLTGVGDVNTYALFAETISQLVGKDGRAGFIVPTGIATDDSTKAYFADIAQSGRLVSLFDFENRDAIFPGVHRSYKFCLLTLGASDEARFSFFLTAPSQLADEQRGFSLSPEDFRRINPNTRTCPVFRSRMDAELTHKIYSRVPVLIREAGKDEPEENPWGIRLMRMLDMSNDSHLFATDDADDHLPLYEAKMVHQFDHRWATYQPGEDGKESAGDVSLVDKQDPAFAVRLRYWVEAREVYLRIARLPKALLKALADRDEEIVPLALAHLLFGQWLRGQGMDTAGEALAQLFPAWQEFAKQHPFAAEIAPTGLGLCGNSPAGMLFPGPGSLPAEPLAKLAMGERVKTAWYTAKPLAVQDLLDSAAVYPNCIDTAPFLTDAAAACAYAAVLLEKTSPRWLMGWRDICRATDERTVIASVLPRAGVGNNLPLMLFDLPISSQYHAALIGNLTALALDFVARQKVGGTHLNYFIYKQIPVLPPDAYTEADFTFIVPRVLELTYTSHDLAPWAEDLGYTGPPFAFDPERRALLRAELDACYARLYGLTRDELRYILDPADIMGPDYPSETFRVLKKNEEREFNEYRTQRLVLAAWDMLELQ